MVLLLLFQLRQCASKVTAMALNQKHCVPCEDKNKSYLLSKEKQEELLAELTGWQLIESEKTISKEYSFSDFVHALSFVNQVGDIAEAEGHHPDISIWYNRVRLSLSTHSQGGLTENDFILAAKIDEITSALPH
jgi:4a-hydroxytetrahydrobiopterin dehydratase